MKVNFTKADCEYLLNCWEDKEYFTVERELQELNCAELLKFAQHAIKYHSWDGNVVTQIFNFMSDPIARRVLLYKRDPAGVSEEDFLKQFKN